MYSTTLKKRIYSFNSLLIGATDTDSPETALSHGKRPLLPNTGHSRTKVKQLSLGLPPPYLPVLGNGLRCREEFKRNMRESPNQPRT